MINITKYIASSYKMTDNSRVINCNSLHIPLYDNTVQCVVTSPPYFGLRDYGTATWQGGDPECDHQISSSTLGGGNNKGHSGSFTANYKQMCGKCDAIRVDEQVGLEETPGEYIEKLVNIFREVHRVLRPDGTLWLNLGDSYAGSGRGLMGDGTPSNRGEAKQGTNRGTTIGQFNKPEWGLKPKDLIGIPWRVALALQTDGWWLRQDVIWNKTNAMTESIADRCTKSHEYLFILTKSARYYYDKVAVMEPCVNGIGYRNRRSVWTFPTKPYKGAHFATYPPDLVEPCILAGTSEKGQCPFCGAPWKRIVESKRISRTELDPSDPRYRPNNYNGAYGDINGKGDAGYTEYETIGWKPTCSCDAGDPIPQIVLDPFSGAGTTGLVAEKHNRRYVGIELNKEYIELTKERFDKAVSGVGSNGGSGE